MTLKFNTVLAVVEVNDCT